MSGLDTQKNLLSLKLWSYIISVWAADGQQLGPSSQYLGDKWPLGLHCRRTPWSGLFHNLGGGQGHPEDLIHIPLVDGIACCLSIDCSFGLRAIEIFGNDASQVSAEGVIWWLKECGLSLQSPFWASHRGKLVQFPEQPFLQDTLRSVDSIANSPTRHACAGKCGKRCSQDALPTVAGLGIHMGNKQGWWRSIPTAQQNWPWVQRAEERKVVCWNRFSWKFEPISFFGSSFCVSVFLLSLSSPVYFTFL